MNKKQISISIILQYLFFCINPIISLVFTMYQFLINRKVSMLILALSLSIIFIYFPLMYDTSSNYYATFAISDEKYGYNEIRLYNLIPFILKKIFDIDYMYYILLCTFFSLYIWLIISNHYKNIINENYKIIYIFLFTIFSIIYRDIMDLNRFYFATSIFLLFLYVDDLNKYKRISKLILFILLSYISISIHPSSILFVFIYLCIYFFKMKFIYSYWYPILMLFLGIFSNTIISLIFKLSFLNNFRFFNLAESYVLGESKWADGSLNAFDYMQRFTEVIPIFIIYYLGIKLLKIDTFKNNNIIKFCLILIGIVLFFLSYKSLYERYSLAALLFGSFIIYKSLITFKEISLYQNVLLIMLGFRFILINVFMYGIIFTNEYSVILKNSQKKDEMTLKPFYYLTPILFNIKQNGYSDIHIQQESTRGKKYLNGYTLNPAIKVIK